MIKLDIKVVPQFETGNPLVVRVHYAIADEQYQLSVGGFDDVFSLYPDTSFAQYNSYEDYLAAIYPGYANYFLTYANLYFGDIFELGDMLPFNSSIEYLKQDFHSNLKAISGLSLSSGKMMYATGSTSLAMVDSTTFGRGLVNKTDGAALSDVLADGTANKAFTAAYKTALDGLTAALAAKQNSLTTGASSQYVRGDLSLATFPSIPSVTRTTSASTLSLVGTGATGTQISSTKDSTVRYNVSTSTTSTIGGASTSLVTLKKCATNSATEGDWTSVAVLENDQTITLAIALQSLQVMKGQLCSDIPAGWYVKLVNSGTGTHSEAFVSGEKTIYG